VKPEQASHDRYAPIKKRPLLVTIYLDLIVISTIFVTFRIVFEQLPIFLFTLPVGQIVAVVGVWQLKNWGRIALMILLAIPIGLACIGLFVASSTLPSVGSLLRFVLDIVFIWWLASNGPLFEDA
jgi:hypothetical protein